MKGLPRQYDYQAIYRWICQFKREHDGNSPSMREIMHGCGISTTSVTNYILNRLEREKLIVRTGLGKSRAIHVVGGAWELVKR